MRLFGKEFRGFRGFRRINMIINKKQIIATSLVLLLGIGVYINFLVNNPSELTDANKGNYGEPKFVSKDDTSGTKADEKPTLSNGAEVVVDNDKKDDAYFVQARLDKKKSRDEAGELLQSIYTGGDLTADQLAVVAQDAVELSALVESEAKVENLLKAQGFSEVLCYLNGKSANIIVRSDGLQPADAAKIKSTLLSEVEVLAENITIVEVK